jgi:phage terminase small subunit
MRTRFAQEYLEDFNAARAAIRAGYSAGSAASQGPRLLTFPSVRAAVVKAQGELLKAAEASPAAILRELTEMAFLDAGEFFDNRGKLRPFDRMPKAARRLLDLKVVELFEKRGGRRQLIGRRYTLNLTSRIDTLKLLVTYLLKSAPIKVRGDNSEPKSSLMTEMKGRGAFQRRRFVLEYLKDLNATQAAIRAGYARKRAGSQGQRLLVSPTVGPAIAEAWSRLLKKSEVSLERCRDALTDIALFNPLDWMDDNGALLPIKRIPKRSRRALTWLRFDEFFDSDKGEQTPSRLKYKIRCPRRAAADMLTEVMEVLDPRGLEAVRRDFAKDRESLRRAFFAPWTPPPSHTT